MRSLVATVVSTAVLATACTAAQTPSTAPPVLPATVAPAPTSTLPPPTAPAPPRVTVAGGGTMAGDLRRQVAAVYLQAMGLPNDLTAEAGLSSHLAAAGLPPGDIDLSVEFAATTIDETRIGVVVAGDDVIVASRPVESDSWSIIGVDLARAGLAPWFGEQPYQIFVIGSDARSGQDPLKLRADSLHIVSVAADGSSASIVGIPRDSWVEAPYGGRTKITNTMASRGPEVVTEAAEMRAGLHFDGYILTAFAGFVRLVDDMGGMTVDIPQAMNEPKSGAYFSPGVQDIDGSQALAFARNRTLAGGDLTRSFHQGVIMQWGLLALREQGPLAIPLFLDVLDKHTYTNLTPEQLALIAAAAVSYEDPLAMPNLVAPAQVGSVGAASVVFLTDEADAVFADLADRVLDTLPD